MTNPKRNRDDEALRKRFVTGEQQAIDALARWVTHPAVRPVIERRRIQAETVVMPIARHLVDQEQSARFCWRVFGIAGVGTDWNLRQGEPWWLTPDEANAIEEVEGAFRAVVQFTVDELAARGVGLAPSWAGDHAVVGELLLVKCPMGVACPAARGRPEYATHRRDPLRCIRQHRPAGHLGESREQHNRSSAQLRTAPSRAAAPGSLRDRRHPRPARTHTPTSRSAAQSAAAVARC